MLGKFTDTDSSNADVYSSYITLAVLFPPNLLPSFVVQGSAPDWFWETADLFHCTLSQNRCSCLSQSPLMCMGYYLITAVLACQFSLQACDLPSHLMSFIFWITLFSWLCCLTAWSALSLSALVIPSINHSTTTFTAINLLPVFQIKTHFSLPYVDTSNKHRLNVFHF